MLKGPPLPPPRWDTINAAFREAADCAEGGVTFVDIDESETKLAWSEVYGRARKAAEVLRGLGVRRGDPVSLILPTCPGFMDAFFGTLLAGGTPTPLSPPVRLGQHTEYHPSTARMIQAIGARLVITDRRLVKALDKTIEAGRPGLRCYTVDIFEEERTGQCDEPVRPDDIGLIQFSSGTTVDPKAVALSQRQLIAQCAALTMLMPAPDSAPQIGVSWLPLHHDMGLIGPLLTAVCYGRSEIVLIRPEHFLMRPSLWLRAIARHHAALSPAPNFGYALCLKRIRDEEMAGADLSSWRYALNGSEVVSMDVVRRFGQRFGRWGLRADALLPVYGLAEASLSVAFSAPGEPARAIALDAAALASTGEVIPGHTEIASVGAPVPGFEIDIRDETGGTLPDRRVGRVFVRGPSVMTGYYDDPEATARVLRDGWLDTGDLGFVIDGALYVSGRAKDVVIIRGANYTCEAFEACVESIDALRAGSAAALGYTPPDADGEELLIIVERAPRADPVNDPLIVADVRAAVIERMGVRPNTVLVLEAGALPRTTSGKLRRAEALRRFVAGELVPASIDASAFATSAGRPGGVGSGARMDSHVKVR